MTNYTDIEIHRIAALPGGEAVISNNVSTGNQVWRLNKDGRLDQILYSCVQCVEIGALLLLSKDVFVIHTNGTLIQIDLQTNRILHIYTIENVASVIHTGCLYSDPTSIDKDLLLLADQDKGEVFSYRLSSNNKQVHLRRLNKPSSVSYYYHHSTIYYVVCDSGGKEIQVYDRNWTQVWSFHNYWFSHSLRFPSAAIVSSEDTLIIAVRHVSGMNFIYEYNIKGELIQQLLEYRNDQKSTLAISFHYPFFWVGSSSKYNRHKFVRSTISS